MRSSAGKTGERAVTERNRGDADGLICPICMEASATYGDHHVCFLPCGHTYGFSCIQKWLQQCGSSGKCPQCKRSYRLKDVKKLFASIHGESQKRIQSLEAKCIYLEKKRIQSLEAKCIYLEKKNSVLSKEEAKWREREAEWKRREAKLQQEIRQRKESCLEFSAGLTSHVALQITDMTSVIETARRVIETARRDQESAMGMIEKNHRLIETIRLEGMHKWSAARIALFYIGFPPPLPPSK
ncbi:Zinc finger, RING-type [Corchorus olitorius]|uniref:Zinc finger, RING-type n=1 Tax=Corchorus olitorius TaxID=93759 RepID=A0A1R3HTE5_9ROSI|nr:Zinc finger, RING-type [Corchorus olitorius]